jgi:hypothetical protein
MTLETLRAFFGWCTLLNWLVLLVWFLFFAAGGGWVHRVHAKWAPESAESFRAIHYGGMMAYKVAVLLFCLVPYLALRIVG